MSASGLEISSQNQLPAAELDWPHTEQGPATMEQHNLSLGRWWFAFHLCPTFAATLSPLATAFTICSLIGGWTAITTGGHNGAHVQDQMNVIWARTLNIICLCAGLFSNVLCIFPRWSLLGFIICSICLSAQCFGLAGMIIEANILLKQRTTAQTTKLNQAYYYAISSSAFSFLALLCVLLHGFGTIKRYYPRRAEWSSLETALFRQSISLTAYLLIGAVIFASLEDWAILDALFFVDFTLLTVGLGGEFTPKNASAQTFLLFYAIIGIALVALMVISVRKMAQQGHIRVTQHFTGKYLKELEGTLAENNECKNPMVDENTFDLIRSISRKAEKTCSRIALTISIIATLMILFGGAAVFKVAEADQDWTYGDSCYFTYISLLTIGYGDLIPTSEAGKSFFVVWSLLAVPILTVFIGNSVDTVYGTYRRLLSPFRRLFQGSRYLIRKAWQSLRVTTHAQNLNHPMEGENIETIQQRENTSAQEAQAHPTRYQSLETHRNLMDQTREATLQTHCLLLANELRNAIRAMKSETTKKYSFSEWNFYMRLTKSTCPPIDTTLNGTRTRKDKSQVAPEMQNTPSLLLPIQRNEWVVQVSPLLCSNEPEYIFLAIANRLTELLYWESGQSSLEH